MIVLFSFSLVFCILKQQNELWNRDFKTFITKEKWKTFTLLWTLLFFQLRVYCGPMMDKVFFSINHCFLSQCILLWHILILILILKGQLDLENNELKVRHRILPLIWKDMHKNCFCYIVISNCCNIRWLFQNF